MKCDTCPFAPMQSEAGDYDDCIAPPEYQVVWKDGRDGCSLTYRQLKKMSDSYADHLGELGEDMGVDMDFENRGWDIDRAIEVMKHMIGLDGYRKPYIRHGKKFYRPYRNYYSGANKYLDYFSSDGLKIVERITWTRHAGGEGVSYALTRHGLDFLGRRLGITIYDEED